VRLDLWTETAAAHGMGSRSLLHLRVSSLPTCARQVCCEGGVTGRQQREGVGRAADVGTQPRLIGRLPMAAAGQDGCKCSTLACRSTESRQRSMSLMILQPVLCGRDIELSSVAAIGEQHSSACAAASWSLREPSGRYCSCCSAAAPGRCCSSCTGRSSAGSSLQQSGCN
jgi:hypothetical protein